MLWPAAPFFVSASCRTAKFSPLPALAPAMMTQLLDVIVLRVLRCLERDGLLIRDPEQPWLDLEARDALDALGAASIQYRIAVGPHAGRKVLTLKLAPAAATSSVPKPFTVARDGFSLNAAVACAPHQRDRIERLCRYITRPALAPERLSTNAAGQVVYQLKTPYRDGTTHFVFEPIEFLARLAALMPTASSATTTDENSSETIRIRSADGRPLFLASESIEPSM